MLTTDLFTRERLCSRTVTSRSRCSFPMIGIIDSAISSRCIQFVNESSLTVTDLSFELGGAHMLGTPYFDHQSRPSGGSAGTPFLNQGGRTRDTLAPHCTARTP